LRGDDHDRQDLALVDGSVYSESVCDHAAWAAKRTGAPSVELIHVLGRREAPETTDLSGSHPSWRAAQAAGGAGRRSTPQRAKLVMSAAALILEDARAIVDAAGVPTSPLGCAMATCSRRWPNASGARVIVVGKRGEAADFAKGSSRLEPRADRARGHAAVLIAARAFRPIERVLVAYDGGRLGDEGGRPDRAEPVLRGARRDRGHGRRRSDAARKGLDDARALLKAAGLEAETRQLDGRPEDVLASGRELFE
jgi:hypothetical protein